MQIRAGVNAPKARAAFTVEKLEGTTQQYKYTKKNGGGLVREVVEVPRGWLVRIPKPYSEHSHSIHIQTMEEMTRLGYDQTEVPLLTDEDDVVAMIPNVIKTKQKESINA